MTATGLVCEGVDAVVAVRSPPLISRQSSLILVRLHLIHACQKLKVEVIQGRPQYTSIDSFLREHVSLAFAIGLDNVETVRSGNSRACEPLHCS